MSKDFIIRNADVLNISVVSATSKWVVYKYHDCTFYVEATSKFSKQLRDLDSLYAVFVTKSKNGDFYCQAIITKAERQRYDGIVSKTHNLDDYLLSDDGKTATVLGHTFTIGQEVPFTNTRSNRDVAIIGNFRRVDGGKIWFNGINKRTGKSVYYGLHCSIELRELK